MPPLDAYNVVWTTPSEDHNGSMPIGNGDLGMNAWVEPGTPTVSLGGGLWSEEVTLNAGKTTFVYVSKIDLAVYSHILVQP